MALAATTMWEQRAGATAGMLNGGGFNTAATFGITDATVDAGTGNTATPILSSATYTFVTSPATDVGAWIFVAAGTNWTKGFYKITAVSGGKATLDASIGSAIQLGPSGFYDTPSTVAGCATVGTPTAGTIGVDYSQQNAADITKTDFISVGSSTTLTSVSAPFKLTHIGNIFHLTTAGVGGFGVVGWYEITAYASTSSVTTDRTTNNGTALAAGTGYIGGAMDLTGALPDSFYESIIGGNIIWFHSGSFTQGSAISVASASATTTNNIRLIGYTSFRGDACNGTSRPSISLGSFSYTLGGNVQVSNLIFTGSGTVMVSLGVNGNAMNCKFTNTSTTAGRPAAASGNGGVFVNCEAISQNGNAFVQNSGVATNRWIGCYAHDSDIGMNMLAAGNISNLFAFCIFESNKTAGLNSIATIPRYTVLNCLFYGSEAKIGIGFTNTGVTSTGLAVINSIFYGLTTGFSIATGVQDTVYADYNDYFNNTADRSNVNAGLHTLAVNPSFAGAAQLTGSTATTSGSVLTQSGGDFSTVTDNVDFLRVTSGTGVTTGIYLITSHTATTLTVNNALGTSSGGDVVWTVPTGHNFAVGVSLKAQAFPGAIPGSETTGYLDTGPAQRVEPVAGEKSFSFLM